MACGRGYAACVAPIDPQAAAADRRADHLPVGFIVAVAACSLVALGALAVVAAGGALSAGIGLTLALLPIPVLLAAVLYLDRLEPEPRSSLVFTFLWGAGVAALIGLIGTVAGSHMITTPALRSGGFAAASPGAAIGVAVLEETLMGVALVGLLVLRPQEIDGVSDGVVYGSMVGLGFALIENIYYYTQASRYGFGDVATTFVQRGVVSPLCQALFASLIGAGVAYAAVTSPRRGLWAVAVGWIAAVGLHALWNASLGAGGSRLAVTYTILAAVFVALVAAVIVDRQRIIGLIVRYLPRYEPTGVISAYDISMLSSLHARRQARVWARLHGKLGGLRDMSEFQLSATELALLHRRSDRGLVDAEGFAQRRGSLLGGMQRATSAFLNRLNGPLRPPWAAYGQSCFQPIPKANPAASQPDQPPTQPGPGLAE
jgi:RsiW-degrading membrane proteinase PrsW (M82 family)